MGIMVAGYEATLPLLKGWMYENHPVSGFA